MPWTDLEKLEVFGKERRMPEWNTSKRFPTAAAYPSRGLGWPVAGPAAPAPLARSPIYISRFLSQGLRNPEIVAGLDKLERALTAQALDSQTQSGLAILPAGDAAGWSYADVNTAFSKPGVKLIRNHLLRNCLVKGLEPAGEFDPRFHHKLRVVTRFLDGAEFYDSMSQGQHMKDVLVGLDHGEWTHLLQWYLIAQDTDRADTDPSPLSMFKYLASQAEEQLKERSIAGSPRTGPNLWQTCCDRVAPYDFKNRPRASHIDDFRCPDMLHVVLCGYAPSRISDMSVLPAGEPTRQFERARDRWLQLRDRWPLLCVLLRRRLEKRDGEVQTALRYADHHFESAAQQLALAKDPEWVRLVDIPKSIKEIQPEPKSGKTLMTQMLLGFRHTNSAGVWVMYPDWDQLVYISGQRPSQAELDSLWRDVVGPQFDRLRAGIEFRSAGTAASVLYAWRKDAKQHSAAMPADNHHTAWAALPTADKLRILQPVTKGWIV